MTRTHWSRTRGIVAAVAAVAVVAITLVVSRMDLAAELSVVRAEAGSLRQELEGQGEATREAESERDAARQGMEACAEAARLGREAQRAFALIRDGVDTGDEARFGRGLLRVTDVLAEWRQATDGCLAEGQGPEE